MSLHAEYRKDWRSDERYARDIKEGHVIERQIIERYADYLFRKYGMECEIEDHGIDNSGEIIDEDKVDSRADYKLNGRLIEIKFIKEYAEEFRLKKDNVLSCIEQDASILLVNGWLTDNPTFTVIKKSKLMEIVRTKNSKPFESWGYKRCYFLKKYHFQWFSFE